MLPGVITFGAGHFYVSQSDKGRACVRGATLTVTTATPSAETYRPLRMVCEGGMAIMPMIGCARLLRMWGGVVDMSMDGSPFIDRTHINGLYLNAGWCYGGFKATPASGYCYAHLLATNRPHKVAKDYRIDRFRRGAPIDEKGQGAQPNLH